MKRSWCRSQRLGLRTVATCLLTGVAWSMAWPDVGLARREILTAEQKTRIRQAERILVESLALTERGSADPSGIARVVATRLSELGYTVVNDQAEPHDLTVKVKCEESKLWQGTARSGGDADVPGAPSRLWQGPACQVSYRLDSRAMEWRHEVRTEFQDAQAAARTAGVDDAGAYALSQLMDRLGEDPFPFILAAEWDHTERLLRALDAPGTKPAQMVTVISLLGHVFAVEAIPKLAQALKDPDPAVAKAAAVAIGAIGSKDGVTVLLDLFKTGTPELRAAAANGLGRLAPYHPQADIVPVFLDALPRETVAVQREIIRAFGKLQDRRTHQPLKEFDRTVRALNGAQVTPEVVELRKALGIALDQFDGPHSNE